MKFDTIESVLKNQHFDEKQKINIRQTLFNSRYSRLSKAGGADVTAELVPSLARFSLEDEEGKDGDTSRSEEEAPSHRLPFIQLDNNLLQQARRQGLLASVAAKDDPAPSTAIPEPKVRDSVLKDEQLSVSSPLKLVSSQNSMLISVAESQARNAYKLQHQNEIIRNKLLGKRTEHDSLLREEETSGAAYSSPKSPPNSVVKPLVHTASSPQQSSSVTQLRDLLTETKFSFEPKNKKKEANEAREAAARRLQEEKDAQQLAEKMRLQRDLDQRAAQAEAEAEKVRLAAKQEQERLEAERRRQQEQEAQTRARLEQEERLRKQKEAAEAEEKRQREEEQLRRERAESERVAKEQAEKEKERVEALRKKEELEQQHQQQQQAVKVLAKAEEIINLAKKALETVSEAASVQNLRQTVHELESSKQSIGKNAQDPARIQQLREMVLQIVSQAKATEKAAKPATSSSTSSVPKAGSAKAIDLNDRRGIVQSTSDSYYERHRQAFERFRHEAESALNEPSLKAYKFDLQKAINFPVNSLVVDEDSEENRRMFVEKIRTITRLLSGQTCAITSTLTVNPTKHPKAVDFCLVYLARKLIDKSEETVASRPETAFQYCRIITEVCKCVGHFESIILGQFQEKCPFVVPLYKPRAPNQPLLQYQESIGYKIIDGKAEDEIQYYKRMNGIMHFYFTLLISQPPNPSASGDSIVFNNNGLKRAWQWLSDVLNMTPRANMTADMLLVFFKCCGFAMQRAYGQQFLKLFHACFADYLQLIKAIPSEQQNGANVGRLDTFYEQFRRANRFAEWKP